MYTLWYHQECGSTWWLGFGLVWCVCVGVHHLSLAKNKFCRSKNRLCMQRRLSANKEKKSIRSVQKSPLIDFWFFLIWSEGNRNDHMRQRAFDPYKHSFWVLLSSNWEKKSKTNQKGFLNWTFLHTIIPFVVYRQISKEYDTSLWQTILTHLRDPLSGLADIFRVRGMARVRVSRAWVRAWG